MTRLLDILSLKVAFRQGGVLKSVMEDVSFSINRGECLALVGESGSGKSVTALSVLRLLPAQGRILEGEILLEGVSLLDCPERDMDQIRGQRIAMIFQDPMTALNPVMTLGDQLREALPPGGSADVRRARIIELLEAVELEKPEGLLRAYPLSLSGGMRQRVLIAMALARNPSLLIADEPTTALDVTHQAHILRLLKRLQAEKGMALWVISHDLGVVEALADRVVVMKEGRVVESGGTEFFSRPKTDYGQSLLSALPRVAEGLRRRSHPLPRDDRPLLKVSGLSVIYGPSFRGFCSPKAAPAAVKGVDLELLRGDTLAIVGRSGCGKTSLARALLGLIPMASGQVAFQGRPLETRRGVLVREIGIQAVFQDPFASMNPRLRIRDILEEGLLASREAPPPRERLLRITQVLEAMNLDAAVLEAYPHEFSGGQRQRLCIARALVLRPSVLLLDEPTSALDVTLQARVLDLLKQLKDDFRLSFLLITHDLGVVAALADRVLVMEAGEKVEEGPVSAVLTHPAAKATRALLEALPAIRR